MTIILRDVLPDTPAASKTRAAELTPPNSAGAEGTLVIRGVAVPRSPRGESSSTSEDPFVSEPSAMERVAAEAALDVGVAPSTSGLAPREDRLAEPLSADNAQARLPPQACIFVANLSNQRTDLQLQEALEHNFNQFGRCYAKIRRDRNKMPMAFVSFHEVEHARTAIRESRGMIIDGRTIRAEHAKADRTVLLTRHTGGAISGEEASEALSKFGAIEETCAITVADQKIANLPEGRWVKFAYPQDCFDAQFAFRNHDHYRLVDHHVEEARPQHCPVEGSVTLRDPARYIHVANSSSAPNAVPIRNATSAPTITPAEGNVRAKVDIHDLPEDCFVYVGNLPVDVTRERLCELFCEFGAVRDAQIRRRPYPNSDRLNTFAFVCFEDPQTVDTVVAANLVLGDHDIRVERKEYSMRRRMREQRSAYARRRQDSAFVNLYHQALQMGLSQTQAEHILNMGRQPPHSSTYSDPSLRFHLAEAARHHPSLPTYHLPQYRPQHSFMEYQQQFEAPHAPSHYGQYTNVEPTSPAHAQFMFGGTTYYQRHDPSSQVINQYQASVPMEPMYDPNYTFGYGLESYPSWDSFTSASESQHQYSHESYGPATYAGEAHASVQLPSETSHRPRHSYH